MKLIISIVLLLLVLVLPHVPAEAQTMRVWKDGAQLYSVEVSGVDSISFFYVEEQPVKEEVPEFVDLGLSVKWASCNLGATSPEQAGDYYAWGETEPNGKYEERYYKYCKKGFNVYEYTKYNKKDEKLYLEMDDDAAHVKYGGKCRIPTDNEWRELLDENNCEWKLFIVRGKTNVQGFKVTSKKEGYTDKSIFLPAAGFCMSEEDNSKGRFLNNHGYYWSSRLFTPVGYNQAYILFFSYTDVAYNNKRPSLNETVRADGVPIRPVSDY